MGRGCSELQVALRILGGGCDLKVSLRDLSYGQLRDEMSFPLSLPACTLLSPLRRTRVCGIVAEELMGQTSPQSLPLNDNKHSQLPCEDIQCVRLRMHQGHKENCAEGPSAILPNFVI